ncbi:hypothetical protein [Streptomyces sp. NBC_00212]|uniref:hypothetical protein n=1 Tax=Streptomyces sp. NBC_00212 TaxID=2975684 RepID=UPI00325013D6
MAFDVEIAVAVGVPEVCEDRYRRLLPYEQETVVIGGGVAVLAPVALYLGLAGTGPKAAAHLEDALVAADRLGARPIAARARLELGRLLLAHDPAGERGRLLLSQALTAAEEQSAGCPTGPAPHSRGRTPATCSAWTDSCGHLPTRGAR